VWSKRELGSEKSEGVVSAGLPVSGRTARVASGTGAGRLEVMARDAEVSGALEGRSVMAAEHAERADRAQRLSDRAREQAGLERAAAERSERLIDEHGDPGLADIHRQVAALHRQAERLYARASELQREHAAHERDAAEGRRPGADPDARAGAADRRDVAADEREHQADLREHAADNRERLADERDGLADERERAFDASTGRWTSHQREHLVRAKATLRRLEAGLARQAEALSRSGVRDARDSEAIEREIAETGHSATSYANAPGDDAQKP
jgi:hypothetical protein